MTHMAHMPTLVTLAHPGMPTVSHVTIDHLTGTPVYVQLAAFCAPGSSGGDSAGPAAAVIHDLMQEHE